MTAGLIRFLTAHPVAAWALVIYAASQVGFLAVFSVWLLTWGSTGIPHHDPSPTRLDPAPSKKDDE